MASSDTFLSRLQHLSISPLVANHDPTDSPAAWKHALTNSQNAPSHYELIKTLVYKPKTAKTSVPVPVVAIVREDTETNSSALGKKLSLKELRLANEDLMKEFFGANKDSSAFLHSIDLMMYVTNTPVLTVSPLSLDSTSFPKVVTVLDSSLAASDSLFAVHAGTSDCTIFLKGNQIASYLDGLQTSDHRVQQIDFSGLHQDAPSGGAPTGASPAKPVGASSDVAKIEGAVQIAIGIKKDVDFAAWYTNVMTSLPVSPCISPYACSPRLLSRAK